MMIPIMKTVVVVVGLLGGILGPRNDEKQWQVSVNVDGPVDLASTSTSPFVVAEGSSGTSLGGRIHWLFSSAHSSAAMKTRYTTPKDQYTWFKDLAMCLNE